MRSITNAEKTRKENDLKREALIKESIKNNWEALERLSKT